MIVALIVILNSCSEDVNQNDLSSEIQLHEQIGLKHNNALRSILLKNTIGLGINDKIELINDEFKVNYPNEWSIYNEFDKTNYIKTFSSIASEKDKYIDEIIRNSTSNFSKDFNDLMIELRIVINNSIYYEELSQKINDLEIESIQNLNDIDKDVFLSTASVARYSAKFWLPEEFGGENGLQYIRQDLPSGITKFSWGGFILSDAVGVLVGAGDALATSGGAAALPCPATGGLPKASVAGLVVGVGASVLYAID
jgi:hypothetical protein